MTENQWPQAAEPASTNPYPAAGTASPAAPEGSQSKKDVAKDEAANVAGQAAGAAQNVAETAKAEAANVASEVKTSTKDLLHQAKSDLTSQAGTQQQKAAEGIRTISSQLRTMADAPDQQGVASDLIRQAADRSASVASWLENRDPGSLLDEAKSFARQRPGAFLLLAAGAGLLAGRLGRSLQAGASATSSTTGTAVPPQPRQSPATEANITAGVGEPFYDETTTGLPPYAETVYGEPPLPGATRPGPAQTLPGSSSAGVPLRDVNDPYTEGEGRPL
ncbi:hypothetical protein QFZ79_000786 [Arthrobacter sp. V4I6]|uniref:hypothetical protein n=1 Tax=unclassified Arthrobacter TaxID=235627 RepID=UPI002780DA1E|nr:MULTISPECIES: hypothetical protein [unclassified Arthrobacter]MDQ0823043.1 hypothetical protein [Arthrobacter sp. V1I7]MDQ0852675.1 hypothetical protein [Arthrobacter sp. V4I6]